MVHFLSIYFVLLLLFIIISLIFIESWLKKLNTN